MKKVRNRTAVRSAARAAQKEEIRKRKVPKIAAVSSEWYYIIKVLAIICMIIDHTAKVIGAGWSNETQLMMRMIGRMAFPLFAWELVECFHFTKDKGKHLTHIFMLAVLSELPYDKAMYGKWFDWEYQNVCLTFFIGWLMLTALNADWDSILDKLNMKRSWSRNWSVKTAGLSLCLPLFVIAQKCGVDYGIYGVGLVCLLEFARGRKHRKLWEFICICCFIGIRGISLVPVYLPCFFCLVPMWLAQCSKRNEQRSGIGRLLLSNPVKIICRFFYPVHFIILIILKGVLT